MISLLSILTIVILLLTVKEKEKVAGVIFSLISVCISLWICILLFPPSNVKMIETEPLVIKRNLIAASDNEQNDLTLIGCKEANNTFKYSFYIDTEKGAKREDVNGSLCPVYINNIEADTQPYVEIVFENNELYVAEKPSKRMMLLSFLEYYNGLKAYEENFIPFNAFANLLETKPLTEEQLVNEFSKKSENRKPLEIRLYVPEGSVKENYSFDLS